MIRDIVTDEEILSVRATKATRDDMQIAQDLIDTYQEHTDECVGLAANMIGETKRIIVLDNMGETLVMFNPAITDKKQPFITEESCLSIPGNRKVTRYKRIKVRYQDMDFKEQVKTFRDWPAQIIQHEVDHCNGILV